MSTTSGIALDGREEVDVEASKEEADSERDDDRDSDFAESLGDSDAEDSSDTGGQDGAAKRSDSMGSSSSAATKPATDLHKPMPLWDDGSEEQDFTVPVQSGTGWKLQDPAPQHTFKCPEKEPLGVRLQDVLPSGLKDNSKYDAMAKEMQGLDELRTGQGQVVYLRESVNFLDPFKPYYVLEGSDDLTLQFESRFESGNLAQAVKVAETEYDLEMSKDYNTGGHTQWFYFRVTNARQGVPYKFNLVNFYKSNSLYNSGLRPLLYSDHRANKGDGIGWHRAGERICYYKSNRKRKEGKPKKGKGIPGTPEERRMTRDKFWFTLTFTLTFPHDGDQCYIAHCYPFTFSDARRHISSLCGLSKEVSQSIRRRVLCRTLAGNNCEVLTITNPSADPAELKTRKVIAIAARVHPGECNASWMMKGFLDALLDGSDLSARLLSSFVFKVIPMLNPDGVVVGNYRCALSGHDLNRRWRRPDEEFHPTIHSARAMLERSAKEREVLLFVDLHGHSRRSNVFSYGCDSRYWKGDAPDKARTLDHRARPYVERVFPAYLSMHSRTFDLRSCTFGVSRAKEGCSRVVAWRLLTRSAYTVEASFCGPDQGDLKGLHLNINHLEEFGRDLCVTIDKVFRIPKKRDDTSAPGVNLSRAAEKMEAKMARAMERKEKGGRLMEEGVDSSDSDEEDEDEKEAKALFKQAIIGAVACEGSDDDTSSEDEAILNPKKVVHELRKVTRPGGSTKRKKKNHEAGEKSDKETLKTTRESGSDKSLKGTEEKKTKGGEVPTPKNSDVARRKDDVRKKAAEEAATQKLGALLSNAEQMLAVAQAKSASHPSDCECLLCRAPMLLDAGESLLGKMKGAKDSGSGGSNSSKGWAAAMGGGAGAVAGAGGQGGMRGSLKKASSNASMKRGGSAAMLSVDTELRGGGRQMAAKDGPASAERLGKGSPGFGREVSLGPLQGGMHGAGKEGAASEYGRLRRVVQSRDVGKASSPGKGGRAGGEAGGRGGVGEGPGLGRAMVRQDSQMMRAAQSVRGGVNTSQMRRALEAEAMAAERRRGGEGTGRTMSGGSVGRPSQVGLAGSLDGTMGVFTGAKQRIGSYEDGKTFGGVGGERRRESLGKAGSMQVKSPQASVLPETVATSGRSAVLSRGGWKKVSTSGSNSASPLRDPLQLGSAAELVGKYYGQARPANF